MGLPIIVISGAKEYALRNAAMRTNGDRLEIEDKCFFADPGEVTDRELPGKMNIDPGFEDYSAANARTKQSQQCTFEWRGIGKRRKKDEALHDVPESLDHGRTTAIQAVPPIEQIIANPGHRQWI